MRHCIFVVGLSLSSLGCDSNTRTPTPPPVPDIALPDMGAGSAALGADQGIPDSIAARLGDAGPAGPITDSLAPIPANLISFVPEMLDGVKARRRQVIKTKPMVHGFYQGEKGRIYNLHITGPAQTEEQRRQAYPLLGTNEKKKSGPVETRGFKVGEFGGQLTYNAGKKKSEAVVLVNRFVEVKVSVAPTKKADDAIKLLDEIDLDGVSKLQ